MACAAVVKWHCSRNWAMSSKICTEPGSWDRWEMCMISVLNVDMLVAARCNGATLWQSQPEQCASLNVAVRKDCRILCWLWHHRSLHAFLCTWHRHCWMAICFNGRQWKLLDRYWVEVTLRMSINFRHVVQRCGREVDKEGQACLKTFHALSDAMHAFEFIGHLDSFGPVFWASKTASHLIKHETAGVSPFDRHLVAFEGCWQSLCRRCASCEPSIGLVWNCWRKMGTTGGRHVQTWIGAPSSVGASTRVTQSCVSPPVKPIRN